jgi:hypothetical protein
MMTARQRCRTVENSISDRGAALQPGRHNNCSCSSQAPTEQPSLPSSYPTTAKTTPPTIGPHGDVDRDVHVAAALVLVADAQPKVPLSLLDGEPACRQHKQRAAQPWGVGGSGGRSGTGAVGGQARCMLSSAAGHAAGSLL